MGLGTWGRKEFTSKLCQSIHHFYEESSAIHIQPPVFSENTKISRLREEALNIIVCLDFGCFISWMRASKTKKKMEMKRRSHSERK